jgi:hypothetical protein
MQGEMLQDNSTFDVIVEIDFLLQNAINQRKPVISIKAHKIVFLGRVKGTFYEDRRAVMDKI